MSGRIYISLGGGSDFGIDEDDQLFITSHGVTVGLGLATAERFDRLCELIQRLKIHAVEVKI